MQFAKIMHSIHNNKIYNLDFSFSLVKNIIIVLKMLQSQTTGKLLPELEKANQLFLSQAQNYGKIFLAI